MANSSEPTEAAISESNQLDNNRWCWTGELIASSTISGWIGIYRLNFAKLKRLKICGYAARVTELLDSLSDYSALLDLEIGTMNLDSGSRVEYKFRSLQTFSIDRIQIVAHITEKKQPANLTLDTPRLKKIFFGSSSMQFVKLGNYSSVEHLSVEDSDSRRLTGASYTNLQFLEYTLCQPQEPDEKQHVDARPFLYLLRISTSKKLCFHFNLARISSTTFRPPPDQLMFLSNTYSLLKTNLIMNRIQGSLQAYLNYGEIDFQQPFSSQHFERDLIETYQKSTVALCPWLTLVHFEHLAETILQGIREQSTLEEALRTFAHTFPYVQIVHLVLEPGQRPIASDLFYSFLNSCRAITELKVVNSGFAEQFFERLVQLPSLQASLTKLVHGEPIGFRPPGYHFLQHLPNLISFTTHSATCTTMFYLTNRMLAYAEYNFKFRHPHKAYYYYDCIVRRTSTQFHLAVDRFDQVQPAAGKSLLSSFVTFDGLCCCIKSIKELGKFGQANGITTPDTGSN